MSRLDSSPTASRADSACSVSRATTPGAPDLTSASSITFILDEPNGKWKTVYIPKPLPTPQASTLTEEDQFIAGIKEKLSVQERPVGDFFKNASPNINNLIARLQDTDSLNREHQRVRHCKEIIRKSELSAVGTQKEGDAFNPTKDLDLELLVQFSDLDKEDIDRINLFFKRFIANAYGIPEFAIHSRTGHDDKKSHWLMHTIQQGNDSVDVKVTLTTRPLADEEALSTMRRRLSHTASRWNLQKGQCLSYTNNALAFTHTKPNTKDCAYALLYLIRKRSPALELDPDFVVQMQTALKTDNPELPHIKKEFSKLLAKKGLPNGEYSVETNIEKVLAYMENPLTNHEEKPPVLPKLSLAANRQGFFAPPGEKAAAPKTPTKGFSYAAAAAKKS